ncbi:hypothetical protein EG329_000065 [Mollisiaceae sp. DMI_Dod_QoI]|nr:hypothetical protein EG329_000065 [Helotiales sp. DMI_Dod_QoI]
MEWSPFRLDALGLVTLIGADEVNQAIGRLVASRYTTFLPLLGQYLIAGNQFTKPIPGFTIFNLTDSFRTTSIAGWFSRWLRSQKIKTSTTVFEWTVLSEDQRLSKERRASLLAGALIVASMIVLTVLMGDWWGLANSIALAVSVLVRRILVRENNMGLDDSCKRACYSKTPQDTTRVKLLVTLDDGKLVTIYAPRGLVMAGFLKAPTPVHRSLYTWTRRVGWLFFGVHVIALGQCNLATQIITVAVLIGSTWLVVRGVGCNESEVGNFIQVQRIPDILQVADRRIWAYAKLQPTFEEEDSLSDWHLLPRKVNTAWWEEYHVAKETLRLQNEKSSGISSVVRSDSEISADSQSSTAKPPLEV